MERDKKIQLLLDMQEHPELFPEQALEAMLDDPEVRELMEATAQLKQAMIGEELTVKSEERHSSFQKVAASVIGVLMVSGIAFATIHIARQIQKPAEPLVADTTVVANTSTLIPDSSLPGDTTSVRPIVFDNIFFDDMLTQIAGYYHTEAVFENEKSRRLRFYFLWYQDLPLHKVVESLNHFESVNIIIDDKKLIVR